MSMNRKTVSRYVALDAYPKRASGRHCTSKALEYLPHLSKRWHEGCRDVKQLFAEIEAAGFSGSYSSVWRLVNRYLKPFVPGEAPTAPMPAIPRLSARQAAWLLMCDPADLNDDQKTAQAALLGVSTVAAKAYPLVQAFRRMIKERLVEALDPWLQKAEASGIAAIRRFATSLRSDYRAVKVALLYAWSNGPVEGHVHRLKLIKRQMYGRASFALLRSRVLSSLRPAPAEP
jgi:transposase